MRAVLALALAGCSFTVARPPASVTAEAPPHCTDSMRRPGVDFVTAGVAILGGLATDEGAQALLIGTGTVFGLAGILGSSWVKDCRRKQAVYARLAAGETIARDGTARAAAPPEPSAEPVPEAEPAAARPDAGTSAARAPVSCPKGERCPRGLRCDPLRHRCIAESEIGTERQSCASGGRCDAGLYCDLDRRICLPGNIGLEGGACHGGDRCARGLVCLSGLCVRAARPRTATTPGSTRRPEAPGPSRGGAPPPPDRRRP